MTIKIENVRQRIANGGSDLSADVVTNGQRETVTFSRYSTDMDMEACVASGEPFLVMLLMHAMKCGQDLEFDGPVDARLLHELRGTIQLVLRAKFPALRTIAIRAHSRPLIDAVDQSSHIATGFSGGIDSMQLLSRSLIRKDLPAELSVTMLMHHDVGSVVQREQAVVNRDHAQSWAERLGLAFAGASCDMGRYYEGFQFVESHTLRTVAACLSLAPLFRRYLFASGTDTAAAMRDISSRTIDSANLILLPLLSTATTDLRQFGGECTRIHKMLQVLDCESLLPGINLCARVNHDNAGKLNCGRCFKCFPLLLVAESLGKLNQLSPTFDLASFEKHKTRSYCNFFIHALGPRQSQINRQVAELLRHESKLQPSLANLLLKLIPGPASEQSYTTKTQQQLATA
ncbi:hypothetical protein N9B79_00770 [bacterium]|nr:hypothetical protein [bacterium]MDA7936885.1 hypothetical protein [bacterium]MDB4419376.1 hypothetical protein [bacterium]MDB4445847.1 hypothetical protein [bacterium]MDB4557991.1 hypothetical protein [bacterium]